jgi:16S rRNA (guanine966-N2)-methyltransferase
MRVIAGEAKGRTLRVPRGLKVRPSASRLRESLFGMLESRGAVAGARVLDLFAGSGGLGIEALSRSASALVAVEQDREVARTLLANLEACGFASRAEVLVQPVARVGSTLRDRGPFDLVLIDPPYRSDGAAEAMSVIAGAGVLAAGAWIVVETARGASVGAPEGIACVAERSYGDSQITLLQADRLHAEGEVVHDAEQH